MTRARRVTVCASSNTTSCAAKAAGDWRQGWIVFVDDGTTIGLLDAGSTTEVILRVHQGPLNGVTAASSGTKLAPRLSDTTLYVSYTGTGYAQFADGGFQEGSIFFCDGRGVPFAKSVDVMATGMPRVDSAAGSDPGC
jgi:Tfp pilus assembly protein FimT